MNRTGFRVEPWGTPAEIDSAHGAWFGFNFSCSIS